MDLLFDKDGQDGTAEISEMLTFIDADLEYRSLKPDIKTATNEMIRLIGKPMYELIADAYHETEEGQEDESLQEVIYAARYPIAVKAYMLYAPNNDVSHTAGGRKLRKDDNQVSAFEWQINKDNEALERRYYRALDDLLIALEDNEAWKESEAYKRVNSLFIRTTDEFDEYFKIESRLVLLKLAPGIRQCEQDEILPRIGRERYNALKNNNAEVENNPTYTALLPLIREACVYYALSWAMTRLSVTVFPEGVLQSYTSDRDTVNIKQPAQKMEPQAARQAFKEDAERIFSRIEQLLAPVPEPVADNNIIPAPHAGKNYLSL